MRSLLIRVAALFLACFMSVLHPLAHTAVNGAAGLESKVKAASIYKFLSYVDWPRAAFSTPNAPYVIGIAGAEDVAGELARISIGRTVNNRPLVVKQVTADTSLAGLHVLFVGHGATELQSQLLKQTRQRAILSVTESEGALAQGSIINFRLVDGRVRFEISLAAADKSGLKISSRLLLVAISVRTAARS